MEGKRKADYSIATEEERERVVEILRRNCETIITAGEARDPAALRARVQALVEGVEAGRVYTGSAFDELVKLFRGKTIR